MKSTKLILCFLIAATHCLQAQISPEAEQAWLEIAAAQQKRNEAKQFTAVMTFQNGIDNDWSDALEMHIWKNGDRYTVDHDYMTVWMDGTHNVLLMKEAKTSLLRSNDSVNQDWQPPTAQMNLDSARQYIRSMQCQCENDTCEMQVIYHTGHPANHFKIARLNLVYEAHSFNTKSYTIVQFKDKKKLTQVVTVESYTTSASGMDNYTSVLERISNNGQLKPEFATYDFRDLRSH